MSIFRGAGWRRERGQLPKMSASGDYGHGYANSRCATNILSAEANGTCFPFCWLMTADLSVGIPMIIFSNIRNAAGLIGRLFVILKLEIWGQFGTLACLFDLPPVNNGPYRWRRFLTMCARTHNLPDLDDQR